MDRILLTGGNGMLGKSFQKNIKNKKFKIFSPSRKELDVSDLKKVTKYILKNKISIVVHAAGKVGGIQDNINYPYNYLLENSLINASTIEASRIAKVKKFIFIGSSCMYPKNINREIFEEDMLTKPLENTNEGYAISKIFGYKLCQYSNKQYQTNYKTIVATNLFGEDDKFDGNRAHLVSAIMQKVNETEKNNKKTVEIWGDGKSRRDFIHVDDLTNFIFYCLKNYKKIPEIINFGSGKDLTINQYYKKIFNILGVKVKFKNNLNKPSGMKKKLLSIKKLKKIKYNFQNTLDAKILETYEKAFKKNK